MPGRNISTLLNRKRILLPLPSHMKTIFLLLELLGIKFTHQIKNNYKTMYLKRGIKLPLYFFVNVHLFDLCHKTDTAVMKYVSDSIIPYMSSWTYPLNKALNYTNRLLKSDPIFNSITNLDKSEFSFIDIGCGKGKVLIQAKKKLKKIKRVFGLEKDLELLKIAKKNLAITNTKSILIHGDASDIILDNIISSPIIAFLYNPFEVTTLDKFLKHNPKIALIIYMNPQNSEVLNNDFSIIKSIKGWHLSQSVNIYVLKEINY